MVHIKIRNFDLAMYDVDLSPSISHEILWFEVILTLISRKVDASHYQLTFFLSLLI